MLESQCRLSRQRFPWEVADVRLGAHPRKLHGDSLKHGEGGSHGGRDRTIPGVKEVRDSPSGAWRDMQVGQGNNG